MPSKKIVHIALYEQVADRLRLRIYDGSLKPDEWIDEKAVADEFGISRTPLREALKVLHSEGLVELIPRRGCCVKSLDFDELDEIFPVMAVLEGLCARESVRNCTPDDMSNLEKIHAELEHHAHNNDIDAYYEQNFLFHTAVQNLSANRWLQRITTDLRKIMRLARHHQLTVPGRLQSSINEHERIMDAFRNKDGELADKLMQDHLLNQQQALKKFSEESGNGTATTKQINR